MKNLLKNVGIVAIAITVSLTSCKKDELDIFAGEGIEKSSNLELATLILKSDETNGQFEKVIVNPLVKLDNCKFIVSGTIEYRKNGLVIAVIDFGNGTCDNIATKTVDGKTFEFKLDYDSKDDYKKVIVSPLIKLADCNYIVEGIIEYYKKDVLVAVVDYGNGTCDEWATKTTSDGNVYTFSLNKNK